MQNTTTTVFTVYAHKHNKVEKMNFKVHVYPHAFETLWIYIWFYLITYTVEYQILNLMLGFCQDKETGWGVN